MSKVTVTIEGDDWADVGLQLLQMYMSLNPIETEKPAEAPRTAPTPVQAAQPTELPPWPTPTTEDAPKPTTGPMAWPEGDCPKHKRPWKDGKYGPFCSAKDDSTEKGYCVLRPGMTWNSKKIPSVAA